MNKIIFIGGAFALKTLSVLVVVRFLASGLGDQGFGYLTQYMAFLAVVFGLSLGGASNYLVKSLSQVEGSDRLKEVVAEVFSYGFVFLLILAIILIAFKSILEEYVFYQEVSWWFVLYLLVLFHISNIYGCLMGVALAQSQVVLYALSIIGGALLYVVLGALLVHFEAYDLAYWVVPLSYVLPIVFMRKAYRDKIKVDIRHVLGLKKFNNVFRYSATVYAGLVSLPLVSMFVRELYHRDYGNLALSYWQIAVKYSDAQQQFFGTFCATLLLPYLARRIFSFGFKSWLGRFLALSLIYAGVASIIYVFRGEIIFLLFGDGYAQGGDYFAYYLVGDYFRMAALFCVYTLISVDKFGRALMFEIMQGGAFVVLFYWLSNFGQVQGVGLSYVITYALCFCMMFVYVFDYFRRRAR